jgi:hypothetical protein
MTINDLVDKIYLLNDVKSDFWKEYLERIRGGMKISWYHSAGFDLRPLRIISRLSDLGVHYYMGKLEIFHEYEIFNRIGRELQNTDIVYSNCGIGMGYDLYNTFLNIWEKKCQGIELNDSDLPHWAVTHWHPPAQGDGAPPADFYISVEPLRIFTEDERKTIINSSYINTHWDKNLTSREYDCFALKLAYGRSHVTIIYFCLDDYLVNELFNVFNIDVICVFENANIGTNIRSLIDKSEKTRNPKYVFTDEYSCDKEGLLSIGLNEYNAWDFWHDGDAWAVYSGKHRHYFGPTVYKQKDCIRGNSFCLAIKKCFDKEYENALKKERRKTENNDEKSGLIEVIRNSATNSVNTTILCDVIENNAHYISWAYPGLTYSAHFCQNGLKVNAETYKTLFMEINSKGETGTLYPRVNMTFLPINKANYYMGTIVHRNEEYTREEEICHLKDALIANRDYIKAKKLYLDIRDLPNMDIMLMSIHYKDYYSEIFKELIAKMQISEIDKLVIISS